MAVGKWAVVADRAAPAGGKVLAQQAVGPDMQFNMILSSLPVVSDVDLSVKLRSVKGRIDQGGGLVWRAKDGKNYYVLRYNPLEDNLRVYHIKDGARVQLASARTKLAHKGWHEVRAVMVGEHIQCFLDGKKLLDLFDQTFSAPGRIGLWTKADARTHFDHFVARPVTGLHVVRTAAEAGAKARPRNVAGMGAGPAARRGGVVKH